jgi:hypothetical protein
MMNCFLSGFAFNFTLRRYTTVVFTPFNQNNVGLYNADNGCFSTVAATCRSNARAGAYTRPLSGGSMLALFLVSTLFVSTLFGTTFFGTLFGTTLFGTLFVSTLFVSTLFGASNTTYGPQLATN